MLDKIQHVVVLMLENRSFDQMLGFLYTERGNVSPAGHPFEGLQGSESNPDANGHPVPVFHITPTTRSGYFMPGADPGEHFQDVNQQLFGTLTPQPTSKATCMGFVKDYASSLKADAARKWKILPGTTPEDIMGVFPPDMLPVLSGLARGFAVCDHWFSAVPTMTMPNRAFACAGTSQGHMDDASHSFTVPSIFGLLSKHHVDWSIFGYKHEPLTRGNFPDTLSAPDSHFGRFVDFQAAAKQGKLAAFTFLEPEWSSTGNSQHPNYDVALGEQLIHDVYCALRDGPAWSQTLLIVTYDEHGGNYDHVSPAGGATPPDDTPGEFGFDFTRFGVRVPAVLVSPLIKAGTVFRVGEGTLDHTSILKTVEKRWGLPSLTARDRAAPDLGAVLTLTAPRSDDPLAGVSVPTSRGTSPHKATDPPSRLLRIHAEMVAQLPVPDSNGSLKHTMPALETTAECDAYIETRTRAWKASQRNG